MTKIAGKTVLITGGASGIGKLLGERCLLEDAKNLIIWDINAGNLENTYLGFLGRDFPVHKYKVDVSDLNSIQKGAEKVLEEVGPVDILFNNAGIVVGKDFVDHTSEEIEKTMKVNVQGVMHVTQAFLSQMVSRKFGHIINISSAAGLIPNPKMSVYAASKWAVLGWSESLRIELEKSKSNVRVSTICPSYIDTGMFKGAKAPLLTPMLKPEKIVDEIMKAVKTNEILVKAPFMVNSIPLLRVLPTRIFDFVAETLGVYGSMSKFKGREK